MILDLDCGNTLIMWQLQTNGRVFARGRALSDQELVRQVGCQLNTTPLDLCRLASVRSPAETQELLAVLQMHYPHARLLQAAVVESCAGVHNGYLEPGRLGRLSCRPAGLPGARSGHGGDRGFGRRGWPASGGLYLPRSAVDAHAIADPYAADSL